MRNILYIITLLILLCACDVIKEDDRLIRLPHKEYKTNRTHVLIEFTGFRCVNCPIAAEMAQSLVQLYDSQLIVITMHPASNPFTQGAAKYDYTCPEADTIYRYMGGNRTTPFPTGNIDATPIDNQYLIEPNRWAARLDKVMTDSTDLYIDIEVSVDTSKHILEVNTTLSSQIPAEYRLALWLVEDSVSGVQAMPDGTNNTTYYHRHLLRKSLCDDVWGDRVYLKQTEIHKGKYDMPQDYRCEQCYVVALLFDSENYNILNSKQTTLKIN